MSDGSAALVVDGAVATLTMRRESKRNALSAELLGAVHARLGELRGEPGVRAVVLEGAGRAFCAGMDLRAVLSDAEAPGRLLGLIADVTIALRTLPAVVVAKVRGAAIGGGCGLASACDVAVTEVDAKLGFPEVDLGVCPAVVAPWLAARIGAGPARAVLLRGGTMSGLRAAEAGIVDEAVAAGELDERVHRLTGTIAEAGSGALAATKAWLSGLESSTHDAVRRGVEVSAGVLAEPETRAKLAALYGGATD